MRWLAAALAACVSLAGSGCLRDYSVHEVDEPTWDRLTPYTVIEIVLAETSHDARNAQLADYTVSFHEEGYMDYAYVVLKVSDGYVKANLYTGDASAEKARLRISEGRTPGATSPGTGQTPDVQLLGAGLDRVSFETLLGPYHEQFGKDAPSAFNLEGALGCRIEPSQAGKWDWYSSGPDGQEHRSQDRALVCGSSSPGAVFLMSLTGTYCSPCKATQYVWEFE